MGAVRGHFLFHVSNAAVLNFWLHLFPLLLIACSHCRLPFWFLQKFVCEIVVKLCKWWKRVNMKLSQLYFLHCISCVLLLLDSFHLHTSLQTVVRCMADVSRGESFRLLIRLSFSGDTWVKCDLVWTDSFFPYESFAVKILSQCSNFNYKYQPSTVDKQSLSFLFCVVTLLALSRPVV